MPGFRSRPAHLSTLLISRQMGRPSAAAALMARSVPTITPSTAGRTDWATGHIVLYCSSSTSMRTCLAAHQRPAAITAAQHSAAQHSTAQHSMHSMHSTTQCGKAQRTCVHHQQHAVGQPQGRAQLVRKVDVACRCVHSYRHTVKMLVHKR